MAHNMFHPISINGKIYNIDHRNLLGRGSFGSVYKAYDLDRKVFAVKEIDLMKLDEKKKQDLLSEVQIMQSLIDNNNFVKYYGYTEEKPDKMYIAMELCSKSLKQFCSEGLQSDLTEREKVARTIMIKISMSFC